MIIAQSLKKKFEWIVKWIASFVKNKRIILLFAQHTMKYHNMCMDLPQDSLMFSILYLFFNAGLLEMLNRLNVKITGINFMNNVNLLVFDRFTEKNCMMLKGIHIVCELWMKWHDIIFSLKKYELIHLFQKINRFNMKITINIDDIIIKFKIPIKTLKL